MLTRAPVQVPIKDAAAQEDYLEMIYRLLPKEAVVEDADAEARPSLLADAPPIALVLTIAHRPAALLAPLRKGPHAVVMRAYGAYGLAADLSFCPDDLCLLNRCAPPSLVPLAALAAGI